ncbi:transcriptional regulator family: Fungal Specific TF [Penicillium coprophilum]|uniref:transcriptional regulator family: Fungal Specific TF n=1 Tax=Penicillium coprophilum TaxID=36646 RepID=UPI00239ED907|nr:transcriptional regulator family: Fungal Specific TF [Penicillium coprophilum]KAJ5158575.1 transcriptional regulator family: Fungal Specific TF [Penicillium coprophilum]
MEPTDPRLVDIWPTGPYSKEQEAVTLSRRLQQTAMVCLLQDQFFIRHKLSTFEALLMVIYNLSHNESVDQGWALLGMALNIGIALRCNVDSQGLDPLETDRRRRCWAGILTLHTYQAILFRDIDMSFLLDIKATMPADVNDADITQEGISRPSSSPTQMSVMMFKVRIFRICTEICHHISGPSRLEVEPLNRYDAIIAEEQRRWDATYLVDGAPNILDSSYAYWCILQTYAHQLYLLLHRPFRHSQSSRFLASSRERCITSSASLLDIHRQIYEVPLLRPYLWLLRGVTSLKALHAAVALNSCLLDMPPSFESSSYREALNKLLLRMQSLSHRSAICLKANRILLQLQTQFGADNQQLPNSEPQFESRIEDWTDIRDWFGADLFNWNLDSVGNIPAV